MIVDCGSGTVDLTICKGDFCGGSFVDQEFLNFISQKVGNLALEAVRKD
jgi:hypothetical protein